MTALDPDHLAALEEQQAFLRRSVDDLDREYEAGDLDELDYATLRADYARRAERLERAIEEGRARFAAARPVRSPRRLATIVVAVVAFAVLAGVLVARSAGRRDPGQTVTGADPRSQAREALAECDRLSGQGEALEALQCYDGVLAEDPDNAEALTYRSVVLILAGLVEEGVAGLERAVEADPAYPDAHAYLAIVHSNRCQAEAALAELDALERLNPPPQLRQQTAGIRESAEAQLAGTQTCAPPSSMPPAAPRTTAEERGED